MTVCRLPHAVCNSRPAASGRVEAGPATSAGLFPSQVSSEPGRWEPFITWPGVPAAVTWRLMTRTHDCPQSQCGSALDPARAGRSRIQVRVLTVTMTVRVSLRRRGRCTASDTWPGTRSAPASSVDSEPDSAGLTGRPLRAESADCDGPPARGLRVAGGHWHPGRRGDRLPVQVPPRRSRLPVSHPGQSSCSARWRRARNLRLINLTPS